MVLSDVTNAVLLLLDNELFKLYLLFCAGVVVILAEYCDQFQVELNFMF